MNLLIIGNQGGTHIAESFLLSAQSIGISAQIVPVSIANHPSRIVNRFRRYCCDKVPARQKIFENLITLRIKEFNPDVILVTGCVYLSDRLLTSIRQKKITILIFLTDDPWSRNFKSHHFIRTLQYYDAVFNPRRMNMSDVMRIAKNTHYLPFAYCPNLLNQGEIRDFLKSKLLEKYDIFFYGGADFDRVKIIKRLQRAGFRVLVAGGYWDRYSHHLAGKPLGILNPAELRETIKSSALSLCVVRKANRDGHCMRTFELPFFNACIVAEDTEEHRQIYGGNDNVAYFKSIEELVDRARVILKSDVLQKKMKRMTRQKIVESGENTYTFRLKTILEIAGVFY